jgi:UPF0755 protein
MLLMLALTGCSLVADSVGGPARPGDLAAVVVTVPSGATARSMAPALEEAGVVESASDFTLYVRLTKAGGCIKAGRHRVGPGMSAAEILDALCGAPLPEDVPFTVVEGWRIREIDAALTEKGWIQAGEYAAIALSPGGRITAPFALPDGSLEGYLYPETYMVVPDQWDTTAFIQRQVDLFAARFVTPSDAALKGSPRSLHELVVMASMLEREEPTPANRPLVAGILWKRIDAGWNLGVDATSRYTLDDWNDRKAFLKKLRDPEDPYNTRLRPGLPPTAIGNPAVGALQAALTPEPSEYWYYLHDEQRVLHPSRNVAEHEAFRKQYNVY